MTADHDRLGPAWDQPGDVRDHDRLPENHPTQNIADGPVRRPVHSPQAELLHARLIRCDRRAFHPHSMLLDRIRRIHRHLIIGGIPALDPEVEILQIHVQIRMDQTVLNERPDDPGHLITIELDHRLLDLDLGHWGNPLHAEIRPPPKPHVDTLWRMLRHRLYAPPDSAGSGDQRCDDDHRQRHEGGDRGGHSQGFEAAFGGQAEQSFEHPEEVAVDLEREQCT